MNRDQISAAMRAAIVLAALTGAVGVTTGCVYRPNIQQGNLLDIEDVDQVQAGMTRSQVRYLLGTPMLADPFDPQRWDYIYTFKRGRSSNVERAHFVVKFEGDKVARVEKLDLPDEVTAHSKKEQKGLEPPVAPSAEQPPQPEAPRPDGPG